MSETDFAPPNTTRTDPSIGHVVEDQRSGDRRLIIYVDDQVVVTRDETGYTTLTPRTAFDTSLGSRYRLRQDDPPNVDEGQYGRLRDLLAQYEATEGRKAAHKAEALHEALDVLSDPTADVGAVDDDAVTADDAEDAENGDEDPEVPFEEVPRIGPETAGKLRTQGFLTERDVHTASDEELLAVSGVGPSHVENLREYLD